LDWHPTVEILRRAELVDFDKRLFLELKLSGVRFSKAEATAIAHHLRSHILPPLSPESRIWLDGSATDEPDTGELYRTPEDMDKNYSASRDWLEQFADFCETCGGFETR
jgi:hypothetical protein